MYATNETKNRRGFTLIELLVVMAIILAIAALAAAFAPRVTDSTNLTRSVDQLEQWLLTAKMRAKRDGLATGLRFVPSAITGDTAGTNSQFQYIQQPDPLAGGSIVFVPTGGNPPSGGVVYQTLPNGTLYLIGGILLSANPPPPNPPTGLVTFGNVDFSMGGVPNPAQWLVQTGDYLEVRDGGVYLIAGVVPPAPGQPATILKLAGTAYDNALVVAQPTTNYRILRQPRLLEGEPPLQLPGNFAVDTTPIPDAIIPNNSKNIPPIPWSNVRAGSSGSLEILFSPSGSVIGANAVNGKVLITVYDQTMNQPDINRYGIIAVQSRTGFIGAYSVAPGAGTMGYDPFLFAEEGRNSGL